MLEFSFFDHQSDLQALKKRLEGVLGVAPAGSRLDPTSQFVRAFIASRTYDVVSSRAFARLVARYRSWDEVAASSQRDLASVLAGVTYREEKAANLKGALRTIRARSGAIDLEFLADLPVETGLLWLENIYGVGRKIAAATLNFSTLRKRAFVIDTHILRVMRRYGFVGPRADTMAVYDAVMASAQGFEADDLYVLHWQLKTLGQRICRHAQVSCESCPLSDVCLRRLEKAA